MLTAFPPDYTLNNPDTLTKYKTAAQISEKVLKDVSALCVAGAKIVEICEKGDQLIEEEVAKVYRGKKITKGKLSVLMPAATFIGRPLWFLLVLVQPIPRACMGPAMRKAKYSQRA